MSDEDDWLFRPLLNGMCQYESLKNGVLSLFDIAKMNEALDVQFENQNRLRQNK